MSRFFGLGFKGTCKPKPNPHWIEKKIYSIKMNADSHFKNRLFKDESAIIFKMKYIFVLSQCYLNFWLKGLLN